MTREDIESEDVQRAIEGMPVRLLFKREILTDSFASSLAVDDNLDLVNAQQGLRTLYDSLLSQSESSAATQEKGETIASRVAPALADRPTFALVSRHSSLTQRR